MLNQYDCLRETRTQPIIGALISYRILTEIGFTVILRKRKKGVTEIYSVAAGSNDILAPTR